MRYFRSCSVTTESFRASANIFALICAVLAVPGAASPSGEVARYVIMGPNGMAAARIVTPANTCPAITIDGRTRPMTDRAVPETLPLRATASTIENSKASAFPVRVCEAALPLGTHHASSGHSAFPIPANRVDRLLVIGDTGCRLKAADSAYQACNDPAAWPFARIAARTARWKPDLVLHVGDYLYRENPCPAENPGCKASAWGYGWDAWKADFFDPAAPLLTAAPWVAIRGNHESCTRAGQGWWRLIDPRPLVAGKDCIDPANDLAGDFGAPFAVPLGDHQEIIAMDLAGLGGGKISSGDPREPVMATIVADVLRLAGQARFTIISGHYPLLPVIAATDADGRTKFKQGSPAIQSTFGAKDPDLNLPGVNLIISGHVHLWEQVDYGGRRPSQLIAGFSGTQEDVVTLPPTLPALFQQEKGIAAFAGITGTFGYMTMTRQGADQWQVRVYDVDGKSLQTCSVVGRRSTCQ
jgi:hypothetical protein